MSVEHFVEPATPVDPPAPAPLAVVGTGEGGSAALQAFFRSVPADSGLAYVVATSDGLEDEDRVVEQLTALLSMPVIRVVETVRIEPNTVYVIPARLRLEALDSHLRLAWPRQPATPSLAIDHVLRALAAARRPGIGILLAGRGADGSAGLRDLRQRGGLAVVQEPGEADPDEIPRSALAATAVDYVLPTADIPQAVLRFARTEPDPFTLVDPDAAARLLERMLDHVQDRTGTNLVSYRRAPLKPRIARRMRRLGLASPEAYLARLSEDPDEAEALAHDLLSTSSRFFDDDVFASLVSDALPSLLDDLGPQDTLRAWSIGCGTGEEAYSLAILLREATDGRERPPRVQVFASELHRDALTRAREGFYGRDIEADVSQARLDRFFDAEPGGYRVRPEVRARILFVPQDVLRAPPFSRIDLLVCRDLLGDLCPTAHHRLLGQLHFALRPGGVLLLGQREGLVEPRWFEPRGGSSRLLVRRREPANPATMRLPLPATSAPAPGASTAASLHLEAFERHGPPSVLVDRNDEILHSTAAAGRFLTFSAGAPTHRILRRVSADLRPALEEALRRARAGGAPSRATERVRLEDTRIEVTLEVQVTDDPHAEGCALIRFIASDTSEAQVAPLHATHRARPEPDLRRAAARTAFRVRLGDALRSPGPTSQVQAETAEEIRDALDAARARFVPLSADSWATLPRATRAALALGRAVADTGGPGGAAFILAPASAGPQPAMGLMVEHGGQRSWTDAEIALVEETAQRVHAALEQGRARAALEQSEQRFRSLVHAAADAVWEADPCGAVVTELWNRSRYPDLADAVSRFAWTEAVHPEDRAEAEARWRQAVERRVPVELEVRLRGDADGGRWCWTRVHAAPIRDARGRVLEWVGMNVDVSERRRLEARLRRTAAELTEASRRKDEYLAMLGHELRNPLAAMRSAIELMTDVQAPPLRRAQTVLERQSSHMARIIDGLLEVSRIARGKLEVDLAPLDLRALVERVLEGQGPGVTAQGLTLERSTPDGPVWIEGDETRLVQVLDNLLGNAVKFTPAPGRVSVHLERAGDAAVVRVADTGIGIREGMLDRIFETFQQEPQDSARSTGGLGLGLALAKGIVDLHHGTLEAHSEGRGRGAELTLRLPLAAEPERTAEPAAAAPPPMSILLIEDNADAAEMLSLLLEQRGHRVVTAGSGPAGLEALAREPADVVLCDLGLPSMSGYEVARAIRSRPDGRGLPLVAITGYGQPEDRARSEAAGFDAHLVKPIDVGDLNALLGRFASARAAPESQ